MSGCEIHTTRVGMATAHQVESSQRNRVSGVSRRSRARSCKTDAGMLVAWTLAGKFSLTPRFARRCRCLRHAHARREMTMTFGETISHERSRSNRVCRAEPSRSSNHSSMAGQSFVCVLRFASLAVPVCCSQELGAVQSGRIARWAP